MTPRPPADPATDPSSPSPSSRLPVFPSLSRITLPDGTTASALGTPATLDRPLLALFCSARCPGALIIAAYDLARALRDAALPVVGGFHTPIERDCLELLLRGTQPVVVCPARSLDRFRLPGPWREPIAAGRLLVLSPFAANHRRPTAALAAERNAFVASLAHAALVVHADPGGATHRLARDLLAAGKPVFAPGHPANDHLLLAGARPLTATDLTPITAGSPPVVHRSPPRPP